MHASLGDATAALAAKLRNLGGTVHVIAHSLGGVIALETFAAASDLPPGRIVLLGAPVQGSRAARAIAAWSLGPQILGALAVAELAQPRERRWDQGRTKIGLIAGSRSAGLGRLFSNLPQPNDGTDKRRRDAASGSDRTLCTWQGSRAARSIGNWSFGPQLLGALAVAELCRPCERRWDQEREIGLIAGTRSAGLGRLFSDLPQPNDGTICVEETRLPGATAHCVLDVSHTGMLFSLAVARSACIPRKWKVPATRLESRIATNEQDCTPSRGLVGRRADSIRLLANPGSRRQLPIEVDQSRARGCPSP